MGVAEVITDLLWRPLLIPLNFHLKSIKFERTIGMTCGGNACDHEKELK